jgi:hypothetical protein
MSLLPVLVIRFFAWASLILWSTLALLLVFGPSLIQSQLPKLPQNGLVTSVVTGAVLVIPATAMFLFGIFWWAALMCYANITESLITIVTTPRRP